MPANRRVIRPRFFAPAIDPSRKEVSLPPEEARHLTRVLRIRPGGTVEVFDGRGHDYVAEVAVADRDRVTLLLLEALDAIPTPGVPAALVQSILKPQQMDDVVRDATMMGVERIVPLISSNVTMPAKGLENGRAVERWRRVALASVKQCRRSTLPEIAAPVSLGEWLRDPSVSPAEPRLLLVEPSAGVAASSLRSLMDLPPPRRATLVIGPEGGWAPDEITAAVRAGCRPISLGGLTLRADAVALAALAGLAVVWG
jgi:16S rRNA (uracil1498-N3)-methyltransferase